MLKKILAAAALLASLVSPLVAVAETSQLVRQADLDGIAQSDSHSVAWQRMEVPVTFYASHAAYVAHKPDHVEMMEQGRLNPDNLTAPEADGPLACRNDGFCVPAQFVVAKLGNASGQLLVADFANGIDALNHRGDHNHRSIPSNWFNPLKKTSDPSKPMTCIVSGDGTQCVNTSLIGPKTVVPVHAARVTSVSPETVATVPVVEKAPTVAMREPATLPAAPARQKVARVQHSKKALHVAVATPAVAKQTLPVQEAHKAPVQEQAIAAASEVRTTTVTASATSKTHAASASASVSGSTAPAAMVNHLRLIFAFLAHGSNNAFGHLTITAS